MARDTADIIRDIDIFAPIGGDWLPLDRLLDELWQHPVPRTALPVLFRVFERFPDDDGFGVFWTILHGIESLPDVDEFVVSSVCRNPTHFPVLMVNRMLNAGITSAGGVDLLDLLRQIAANEANPASIRKDAENFLAYQRRRV